MPNFWTKTNESINEALTKPSIKDPEFEKLLIDAREFQKNLQALQSILKNFSSYFDSLFSFNRKLSENIFNIYSSSGEYSPFSEILTKIHVENNRAFQNKLKEINSIIDSTNSWEKYFANVPFLLKEKDDARKNYDHYEKKMLQLIEEKAKLERKGSKASVTFMEKIQRNEEKFIKAKNEYLTKAVNAFDHLEAKIKDRFQLTSDILLRLYTVESKIYKEFNENFSKHENLYEMQSKIEQEIKKNVLVRKYDPSKYVKNLEENFEILKPNIEAKKPMSPGKPSRFQKMPTVNFKSPQKFSKTLTQDSFLQDSIYNQRCETEIFNSECKDSIFEPKISNEVNNKSIFVKKAIPSGKSKNSIDSFNYFKSFGNHFSQKKQSVITETDDSKLEVESKQCESHNKHIGAFSRSHTKSSTKRK